MDRVDCMCKGTEVGKSMALLCDRLKLTLGQQAGDPHVHSKDFGTYSESVGEALMILKQIWKTSHNHRIGWRIRESWRKQCRDIQKHSREKGWDSNAENKDDVMHLRTI